MCTLPRPVLIACLALSTAAGAQTMYRWTDRSGEVHYTDDKSTIPKGVKAETTEGDALSEMEAPPPERPAPKTRTKAPSQVGIEPQQQGPSNAEMFWRSEFGRLRERIRDLEDEIAEDKKKVDDPTLLPAQILQCAPGQVRPNGMPVGGTGGCYYLPNPEYQRTQDRLSSNERALTRAKADLKELERRAANEAVPLEWRR